MKRVGKLLDRVSPGAVDVILSYCHYSINDSALEDLLPYFKSKGVGVITASPLAMGLLTENGPPEWHPASPELKSTCQAAAAHCKVKGKNISKLAMKYSLSNKDIASSLVALYSGCGKISDAVFAFKSINVKNIVSFNSMITGIAHHGLGMSAFTVFGQMMRSKVEPDEITFTGLLSACIHSGMLQKGRLLFRHFNQYRCIDIKLEHFGCMVDILGRCGRLEEAEEFLSNMPIGLVAHGVGNFV